MTSPPNRIASTTSRGSSILNAGVVPPGSRQARACTGRLAHPRPWAARSCSSRPKMATAAAPARSAAASQMRRRGDPVVRRALREIEEAFELGDRLDHGRRRCQGCLEALRRAAPAARPDGAAARDARRRRARAVDARRARPARAPAADAGWRRSARARAIAARAPSRSPAFPRACATASSADAWAPASSRGAACWASRAARTASAVRPV